MTIQVNGESIFTKETANVKMAEVIECPDCAFEFGVIHEQSDRKGLYTCPNCEAANYEALYLQQQKEIREAADLHLKAILELQRIQSLVSKVDDSVHRPIGVALVELEEKFQKIHDEWSK
ncbi:hypothetical protein KQI46_19240 [Lysinibacillus capsici]|uniref:hypothetical protein n=1 Tax=Lysinibacillus capsici TaxID=2115968 RepID=UPI001C0FD182|nr:hypothetical protein [Lysinibacillus capsici]MBU5254031.1 hypothetical protein [Lysinibacillus capsici]